MRADREGTSQPLLAIQRRGSHNGGFHHVGYRTRRNLGGGCWVTITCIKASYAWANNSGGGSGKSGYPAKALMMSVRSSGECCPSGSALQRLEFVVCPCCLKVHCTVASDSGGSGNGRHPGPEQRGVGSGSPGDSEKAEGITAECEKSESRRSGANALDGWCSASQSPQLARTVVPVIVVSNNTTISSLRQAFRKATCIRNNNRWKSAARPRFTTEVFECLLPVNLRQSSVGQLPHSVRCCIRIPA